MTALYETPSTGAAAALAAKMQALIPTLATERLILRPTRIEDFDAFAAMVLGPQGRFYGEPKDRAAAWSDFLQITGTWYLRGHGAWTATQREGGATVGFFHIGAEPGDREPELGYLVAPEHEGQGLATEAAVAVRDRAFGGFGFKSLVSYVDAENARSIRLAQALGAQRDLDAERAIAEPVFVYRHRPGGSAR